MTHTINHGWNFDNSYAQLPELFYRTQAPSPVRSPQLLILNEQLVEALGLNSKALKGRAGVEELAGNHIPTGSQPLAQAYAGHQFGHFTMLGDGRAVLLGEHITTNGARFDIQLKGAGRTPYSRGGDGRAALGPMLREYIISEAMYALGIPTTRSLAVVLTGESVMRETELPGAILTRVAASHIRVGTFQYAAQWGSVEELRSLADYTLQRHYPEIEWNKVRYLSLFKAVMERQAALIAQWQLVGFIHGVMNTDNMAISGETIDYGPCAFMDHYDPKTVFSSIDVQGRYAYGNQPYIGGWNLARFAEALLPLLHEQPEQAVEIAQAALSEYQALFHAHWLAGMRKKLGLYNVEDQDAALIDTLLSAMQKYKADYTNTFRALTLHEIQDTVLYGTVEFTEWLELWNARLERQKESKDEVEQLMKANNPAIIPRNHRVEEALEAAVEEGDYSVMEELLDALAQPYAYAPEQTEYATLPTPSPIPYRTFCGT